ncbi:MAG: ATP-binding protein [Rhodoblastus sp.]
MKRQFVETENVARFLAALEALEKRGAEECSLMVVDGAPGLGKTTALEWWAAQNGIVFLRALKEWSPQWFLADLLAKLRITPAHSFQRRYHQALEALTLRQDQADIAKRPFAVVIDEADHISRNGRIIETIRDFSDNAGLVFVLVGMGKIRDNLTAFPQVASRITRYVRFEPATRGDVRALADGLCEAPIGEDVVGFVHQATSGFNREIKEALAVVERVGKRNGATVDKPVRLADLAGKVLINDRRTGAEIRVPGGV